jgi:hypothetical protein
MMRFLTSKSRRVVAVMGIAIVAAALGVYVATVGATTERSQRAVDVSQVVGAVQSALHDNRIVGATAAGSTLNVTLNADDPSSKMLALWDGKVLARAVSTQLAAEGLDAISGVNFTDSAGDDLNGATDTVTSAQPASTLPAGACEAAGNATITGATVTTARTIPVLGGSCIYTLRVSNAADFDANAPSIVGQITSVIPNTLDHPYIFNVVDAKSTTQMVLGWIPGLGSTNGGQGIAWLPPGASSPAVLGSTLAKSPH